MIDVKLYVTEEGKCPVSDFIKSLDPKMRAKVFKSIDLLRVNGSMLREPFSKPIRDGIFELRARQGSDISRVLYFFVIGNTAVLTNGFVKKTQKTPSNEIELAKKYRKDYQRRKHND